MTTSTETLRLSTPSEREIAMTRVFDARRALVFEALTTPEILKRWSGLHLGWSCLGNIRSSIRPGARYPSIQRASETLRIGNSFCFRKRPPDLVVDFCQWKQAVC
jgi:uncharacterized protein YndB with AHSA1/START domain